MCNGLHSILRKETLSSEIVLLCVQPFYLQNPTCTLLIIALRIRLTGGNLNAQQVKLLCGIPMGNSSKVRSRQSVVLELPLQIEFHAGNLTTVFRGVSPRYRRQKRAFERAIFDLIFHLWFLLREINHSCDVSCRTFSSCCLYQLFSQAAVQVRTESIIASQTEDFPCTGTSASDVTLRHEAETASSRRHVNAISSFNCEFLLSATTAHSNFSLSQPMMSLAACSEHGYFWPVQDIFWCRKRTLCFLAQHRAGSSA